MVYIKRLVMQGFKSFAKRTEIVFDRNINVILGPNGSGKSNVADALCFVLGRLSIKSMRAAKAKNLIFMGSKFIKPSREAFVEIVFDNTDRAFSVDKNEVSIKRGVRINGQSLYKINDEVKTRAEIIELLAQAGIDPHGFNLILQGQIQSIVRMHSEDRRKIIEEVAGIAIYEARKEKSIKELDKTEEKLKEIGTILRERFSLMRNLEKERSQAQKFKELELTLKRCKFTILSKKAEEKTKEINSILKSIEAKSKDKEKAIEKRDKFQLTIEQLSERSIQINKHIQQATGVEQDTLHTQISNLKAELEGLRVRRENYENRKHETVRRIDEVSKSIPELQKEIQELKKKSPSIAKKADELKKKRAELSLIEEERKHLFSLKSELNSIRERLRDKEKQLSRILAESESTLRQLERDSLNLVYKTEEECAQTLDSMKKTILEKRNALSSLVTSELENEKSLSIFESEIQRYEEIKSKVSKIDVCPLCQSKITHDHINHVNKEADEKISKAKELMNNVVMSLSGIKSTRDSLIKEVRSLEEKISSASFELVRQRAIKERKESLKRYVSDEQILKEEIAKLEERRKALETKSFDTGKIEEDYKAKMMEIEEISSRTEEDFDTTLLYKERDVEKYNDIIKRAKSDLKEIEEDIAELSSTLKIKSEALVEKESQEQELNERFKKMFSERDKIQKEIQDRNFELSEIQNTIRQIEDQINYLKIGQAKLDAERESLQMESSEFSGLELISGNIESITERLNKTQESISQIGSINLRALEVYDEVKKEYDAVQNKVDTLTKEKEEIMKIIEEIDKKKTREFMKSFKAINQLFTQNFSKLYTKGIAFLEIENQEDIFAGGVNIVVKLAKGKYFDVTSLSGGEQTLVALSLLFAIQEHKPYHFYIFDEIDAALDKRNSERLDALLHQYMRSGQYIVITHNDAIIMNSNVLYGVSMHEGVSRVLSLQIGDKEAAKQYTQDFQEQQKQSQQPPSQPQQSSSESNNSEQKPESPQESQENKE